MAVSIACFNIFRKETVAIQVPIIFFIHRVQYEYRIIEKNVGFLYRS